MLTAALAVSMLALPGATPSPCSHDQLRVGHGSSQGSAGHVHTPIVFTNKSSHACTLRGYPGVSSVSGPDGRRIGAPASRDPSLVPRRRIVLHARGGKAKALLTRVDVGVLDPGQCHPVRARGLRVFPPNHAKSFYVALTHTTCSQGGATSTISRVGASNAFP
ncbi:MAG: DUF4232 domain-containing protein [Actinomycetota bacterium]|nr:DUF4232 domain-containing protein [Actinomycetota bacterium]